MEIEVKITIKAARVNAGFTLVNASKELGINKDKLTKLERDSSDISRSLMISMAGLYKYPLDYIFFGKQSDFFRIKGFTSIKNIS